MISAEKEAVHKILQAISIVLNYAHLGYGNQAYPADGRKAAKSVSGFVSFTALSYISEISEQCNWEEDKMVTLPFIG